MKAVLVLLVLALGAFAVRGEEAVAVQSADAVAQNDNVAFVPQAAETDSDSENVADMDADTAEEELLDSEEEADNDAGEDEAEAEAEGDAEDEASDAADADAEADAEAAEQFEQEDENESDEETEGEIDQEADADVEEVSFAELDADVSGPAPIARMARRRGKAKKRPLIAPRPLMQPIKFHSERIVAQTTAREDPEMAKLNLALDAVKQDILATNKQINDERRWSIAVHKIVTSYKGKLARVDAHIIALRKEMKALYRKKKQIENLKLQRALETKLKEARAELSLLTTSLKHVAVKQGQLNRSGADLRATIAGIQGQLAKLRGQSLFKKKKCGKGKKFSRKLRKCVKKRKGKGKGRRARKAARKLKRMLKRKL